MYLTDGCKYLMLFLLFSRYNTNTVEVMDVNPIVQTVSLRGSLASIVMHFIVEIVVDA